MRITSVLLFALCFALASAQRTYITFRNSTTCLKGAKQETKGGIYKAGVAVPTSVCVSDFEDSCATPNGVVACNKHDAVCSDSKRRIDVDVNPQFAATVASGQTASVCVSEGSYFHPEAWVIAPAQATVSFVVFVVVAVLSIIATKGHIHILTLVLYLCIIVTSILLVVSYYYLNAFVGVMVAVISIAAYSTKDLNTIPIGMLAPILALMWFTFDGGLGFYQHHGRLNEVMSADSAVPLYETYCNHYYRFSMDTAFDIRDDEINTAIITGGMCNREWLAAEFFFVTLLKIELALLIAAGGAALYKEEEKKEEVKAEEQPAAAAAPAS